MLFDQVTVTIAIIMSPKIDPASREQPEDHAMAPKNSIAPPTTAKNFPGGGAPCRRRSGRFVEARPVNQPNSRRDP